MEYSVKERIEHGQEVGEAHAYLEEARALVADAERTQLEAQEKFKATLEKSKAEVSPDLIFEAYNEYHEALREDLASAVAQADYEKVEALGKTLKELAQSYDSDNQLMPDDVRVTLGHLITRYGIVGEQTDHYYNRARLLIAQGNRSEKVLLYIEQEMKSPRPSIKATPPWTGWRQPKS